MNAIPILVALGIIYFAALEMQQAFGQPSDIEQQSLTRVFGSEFTNEILSKCEIYDDCTIVEFSSPNLIVLHGDVYLYNKTNSDYNTNSFLWRAVNTLESDGYIIDSVSIAGEGSQDLPSSYHVVMSKH